MRSRPFLGFLFCVTTASGLAMGQQTNKERLAGLIKKTKSEALSN